MHLFQHKTDQHFQSRFLTFPLGNKLHMKMQVLVESHLHCSRFWRTYSLHFRYVRDVFIDDELLKSGKNCLYIVNLI